MNYAVSVKLNMPVIFLTIQEKLPYYRNIMLIYGTVWQINLLDIYPCTAYFILHTIARKLKIEKARSKNRKTPGTRCPQPATGAGSRTVVCARYLLRSSRSGPGQVRDAPAGTSRRRQQSRCGCAVWRFATHFLSGRNGLRQRRAGRSDATPTRTEGCAQAGPTPDGFHRCLSAQTRACWRQRTSRCDRQGTGYQRTPPQYRTRHGAEKKTPGRSKIVDLPPGSVETYEALRFQVLNGGGSRHCLAAITYHGMLRGLMLVVSKPTPKTYAKPRPFSDRAPPDKALVRLLANMVLNAQQEAMHVY